MRRSILSVNLIFLTHPAKQRISSRVYQGWQGMNSYNINKKVNIYLHQMTVHRVDKSNSDSLCPICLNLLNVILEEEQVAIAMDSPAYPIEDLGVTMLSQTWQCGHIFCRRELGRLFFCVFFFFVALKWLWAAFLNGYKRQWVRYTLKNRLWCSSIVKHDSCPMCRRLLVQRSSATREHLHDRIPDLEISVTELEGRIFQHAEFLRTHVQGVQSRSTGNDDTVDRNEFSGMYS
jgi:hypothetical protein